MKKKTSPTDQNPLSVPIVRIKMVTEARKEYSGQQITGPRKAVDILKEFFEGADRELFVALCLNAHKNPTGINVVSIGSLTATTVTPREVFKPAILCNAAGIIVAHNHPSGHLEPSLADKRMTRDIARAGNYLSIPLFDHFIFSSDGQWQTLKVTDPELFI